MTSGGRRFEQSCDFGKALQPFLRPRRASRMKPFILPPLTSRTVSRYSWGPPWFRFERSRSEEHTSELQSQSNLVCRLLLEKKTLRALLHIANHQHDVRRTIDDSDDVPRVHRGSLSRGRKLHGGAFRRCIQFPPSRIQIRNL